MYKKIAIIAGSAALMLGAAIPALANHQWPPQPTGTTLNIAVVRNTSNASANTGWNDQINQSSVKKAHVGGDVETRQANLMSTGDANATSTGVVIANRQTGCSTCTPRRLTVNGALVTNSAGASSNTGYNLQTNSASVKKAHVDGEVETTQVNALRTGDATSTSRSWTVVNTSVSGPF